MVDEKITEITSVSYQLGRNAYCEVALIATVKPKETISLIDKIRFYRRQIREPWRPVFIVNFGIKV